MCVVAATATNIQQDLGAGSGWASYPVPIAVGGTVLGSIAWELFSRFTLLGGTAAWITDRLYEAGFEDPSDVTGSALPVSQIGQTLSLSVVSGIVTAVALTVLVQAWGAGRKVSQLGKKPVASISESAAQAVQHVDTRSAADFKAGRKPAGSQLGFQDIGAPASEIKSALRNRLKKGSPQIVVKGKGLYQQVVRQIVANRLAEAYKFLQISVEWSLLGFLYFSSSGNLAVSFTASVVQRLALLAPRRMRQQRFKEMLPARLDMMLEKDDTMYLVYEARQRLESYFEEKLAREAGGEAVSGGGNAS
ncbi:hypothetical protein WJX84_007359 [Apatococcus fuscideae]|uniref:Uncharacterized protein n=1 Tax=Apatococcus fuscideae TaxID=2026836 RepID=A0AAW1SYC3_9CHLO